jgi:hypothetical protein
MKQIHLLTDFDCCGKVYPVDVNIFFDGNGHTLRFNFKCHTHELPDDMKDFDVITTQERHILFNRLVSIQKELEPNLLECVRKFIKQIKHPELPDPA